MNRRADTDRPVLLVEDSEHDAELLCDALGTQMDVARIVHVRDGVGALAWLADTVQRGGRLPALVLVDLKMPRMSGIELLARIRREPAYRHLPVVMMTSSQQDQDLVSAYELGVNAYVRKPLEFNEFVIIVQHLMRFWVTINLIPPDGAV